MFDYIGVSLRGCGYDGTGDAIVTGSSWAEEVNVVSGL